MSTTLGGISDPKPGFQNSADIDSLARFAVQQNNQKVNGALEFVKVVSVKEQVVAGTMYYITLEAKDGGGETGTYEAKVWVKEWEKFKQLQGFKKLSGSDAASA